MLGNFACLLSSTEFYSLNFEKGFRNAITMSNGLALDQAGRFVGPDLNPNSLQWLDDTCSYFKRKTSDVHDTVTDHRSGPIGTASAYSAKFRRIRPRMYIEDLL